MHGKCLPMALTCCLASSSLCVGVQVASQTDMELGKFHSEASRLYESLKVSNTNPLVECRRVGVGLQVSPVLGAGDACRAIMPVLVLPSGVGVWETLGCGLRPPSAYPPVPPPVTVAIRMDSQPCPVPLGVTQCASIEWKGAVTQVLIDRIQGVDQRGVVSPAGTEGGTLIVAPAPGGNSFLVLSPDLRLGPGTMIAAIEARIVRLAVPDSPRLPIALADTVVLCREEREVDKFLVDNLLEGLASGQRRWDAPACRELLDYVIKYPLSHDGYEVFAALLARTPGNTVQRRLTTLTAMATEAHGDQAIPVITYYTACHLYATYDYKGAMAFLDRCEKDFEATPERLRILRALCLTQLNRAEEALTILRQLQVDRPDSALMAEVLFVEGWTCLQMGNVEQARAILHTVTHNHRASDVARQARAILDDMNELR